MLGNLKYTVIAALTLAVAGSTIVAATLVGAVAVLTERVRGKR